DPHHLAAERMRDADQRYTRSREALIGVLANADAPLTIAEIVAGDDRLAISTAYRNLVVFEQAGVVHRIVTSDEHARYELDEALTERHHHHLVCSRCGVVRDFTVSDGLEAELDRALTRVASTNGFAADHHRLDLIGRCERCR
ncbi:MAG: Fur family transcriptional regulator, partial [Acidimicrobiia bacterium]